VGVSSLGADRGEYQEDGTLAVSLLSNLNPAMSVVYVSGTNTGSTGKGWVTQARVIDETEDVLLRLPFKSAYMLLPNLIQPPHGSTSRVYHAVDMAQSPLFPIRTPLAPKRVTDDSAERCDRCHFAQVSCLQNFPDNAPGWTLAELPLVTVYSRDIADAQALP